MQSKKKLQFKCCAFQIVALMLGRYNYIHQASLHFVSYYIIFFNCLFFLESNLLILLGCLILCCQSFFSLSKQVLCCCFFFFHLNLKLALVQKLFISVCITNATFNRSVWDNIRKGLVSLSFSLRNKDIIFVLLKKGNNRIKLKQRARGCQSKGGHVALVKLSHLERGIIIHSC